jgi:hypothetical protein
VRNIGNGPALNIVVAERDDFGPWIKPIRVPPLGRDNELAQSWIANTTVQWLGVFDEDIGGRIYASQTSNDMTRVT